MKHQQFLGPFLLFILIHEIFVVIGVNRVWDLLSQAS